MFKRILLTAISFLFLVLPLSAEEPAYNDSNPAVSPDGHYIAFYSDRTGINEIYLYSFETGAIRQMTDLKMGSYGPTWTPDSQTIIFYSGRNANMEVFRVALEEGAVPEQITCFSGYVSNPVVSPDGREMLITWDSGIAGALHEIFVVDLDSKATTQLTYNEARDYTPSWSPDGTKIAFTSDREGGQFDVYIMDATGQNQQKIADLNLHDYYTEWSPDGRFITFFSGADFDSFSNYIIDVETLEVSELTEGYGGGKVSFCPDMSCLVFSGGKGDAPERLHIANPDGSNVRLLDKN